MSSETADALKGGGGGGGERDENEMENVDALSGSSSSSGEEDEEEEEEPLLKYQRLGGAMTAIVADVNSKSSGEKNLGQSVSCMRLYGSFILLGTYEGTLFIIDHVTGKEKSRHKLHKQRITCVSADLAGTFVATSSDDGRVCVVNVASGETNTHNYYNPVKAVAIDPIFGKRSREKLFALGGVAGKFIINSKGWFRSQDIEIHKGEGAVTTIAWEKSLIAWSNDTGVKIYDHDSEQRIAYVDRPAHSPDGDVCRCNLYWESGDSLIIGWADSVKVVRIRARQTSGGSPSLSKLAASSSKARGAAPSKYAEVVLWYQTDFLICGISPFGADYIAVLAYITETEESSDDEEDAGSNHSGTADRVRPELRIISRRDGEDISSDALPIRGFEHCGATDYHLCAAHRDVVSQGPGLDWDDEDGDADAAQKLPLLYVLSPKDVVVARPRGVDDHITWALEGEDYKKALEIGQRFSTKLVADESKGPRYSLQDLAQRYLGHLLSTGEYELAAEKLPSLLKSDIELWCVWVSEFAKHRQLHHLAEQVPLPSRGAASRRLPPHMYEMILNDLLERDDALFLKTIKEWERGGSDYGDGALEGMRDRGNSLDSPSRRSSATHEDVFDVKTIISRVRAILIERESPVLQDALAELYKLDGQYDLALREYLERTAKSKYEGIGSSSNRSERVFEMIETHNLFHAIQDKILSLVELDEKRAIDLLVNAFKNSLENENDYGDHAGADPVVEVSTVVQQLREREDDSRVLHQYLDALFTKQNVDYNVEKYAEFHEMQVSLYAQYAPERLARFLRESNFYNMDSALLVCRQRKPPLYEEMVFILGRMGGKRNTKDALTTIVDHLSDVEKAIEFVEREGDEELWNELIARCVKNPALVGDLLEHAGSHSVDVQSLIKKIPVGMMVPQLHKRIMKIFDDIKLQMRLREGCNSVLKSDVVGLLNQLNNKLKRGIKVKYSSICELCRSPIHLHPGGEEPARVGKHVSIVAFRSGVCYHKSCLIEEVTKARSRGGKSSSAKLSQSKVAVSMYAKHMQAMGKADAAAAGDDEEKAPAMMME